MGKRAWLAGTAALCGIVTITPADAQSNAGADLDPADIIVTARKRQESILRVPVVATAITQEALEAHGTNDLFAVATRIPGIQLGTSVNSVGTQISIRGIGTTALNQTIDQSTSLNIDGLSLTQGLAYTAALFDVGQVEVLKGPQALFYGKNSPAGVISLRSADPTSEPEFIARAGYEFVANERTFDAIASGPVGDNLKLRLAGRYSAMEGWMRNVAQVIPNRGSRNPDDRRGPDSNTLILRGTALFEPSGTYKLRLKANYARERVEGIVTPLDVAFCPDGTAGVAPTFIPFIGGDDCKLDNKIRYPYPDPATFTNVRNNAVPFFNLDQIFGSLDQTVQLTDGIGLSAVTAFYHAKNELAHLASSVGTVAPIVQDNSFRNRQFTQELRVESDFSTPFNFMLGGFYQDAYLMNHVRVKSNTTLGLPPVLLAAQHKIDIESVSLFGQLRYKLAEQLEFAAGGRWTDERRKHRQFNSNVAGPPVETSLIDPKLGVRNFSPEATLTWTPTDDLTLFGSYKQGFKSGSFNSSTFINATTRSSFNDERVEGGEIGLKTRLADRRLTLNLAGYYYHYSDLQVGALELQQLPGGGGTTFALRTINAASANVRGVDFDTSYRVPGIDGLSIYGAVNYNHARYGSFPNAPCGNGQTAALGCNQLLAANTGRFTAQDLSGRRLVRAPTWGLVGGFDLERPVGGGLTLVLGSNVNYTSRYSTTLVDLPGFEQRGFTKLDANVALRGPDGRWELTLIGRNLTNRYTTAYCVNTNLQNATVLGGQISGGTSSGPAGQDEAACGVERGRQVTLRASARF